MNLSNYTLLVRRLTALLGAAGASALLSLPALAQMTNGGDQRNPNPTIFNEAPYNGAQSNQAGANPCVGMNSTSSQSYNSQSSRGSYSSSTMGNQAGNTTADATSANVNNTNVNRFPTEDSIGDRTVTNNQENLGSTTLPNNTSSGISQPGSMASSDTDNGMGGTYSSVTSSDTSESSYQAFNTGDPSGPASGRVNENSLRPAGPTGGQSRQWVNSQTDGFVPNRISSDSNRRADSQLNQSSNSQSDRNNYSSRAIDNSLQESLKPAGPTGGQSREFLNDRGNPNNQMGTPGNRQSSVPQQNTYSSYPSSSESASSMSSSVQCAPDPMMSAPAQPNSTDGNQNVTPVMPEPRQ